MKKRKQAALYDPYLDTLGGGEKHILSILHVLTTHDYDTQIFWDSDLSPDIKKRFNLDFNGKLHFRKNIFSSSSPLEKITQLRNFDAFFYVTDGSYFISTARRNYIFCMVPQKNLYSMNFVNKMKTLNAVFLSNSEFTQTWLSRWGIKSTVIHPYIDQKILSINPETIKKEKIILSVGRFFGHLHSKKHDETIKTFKKLQKRKELSDFKLVIAGSLLKEDETYFKNLKNLIGNDQSIILKTNLFFTELVELYTKSMYYWHFAGFGVDENEHPEQVEHLGITPLEAMAAGCITMCYSAGGPKLIISSGSNGYLFNNEDELWQQIKSSVGDTALRSSMQRKGHQYVSDNFSYEIFKERVKELLL